MDKDGRPLSFEEARDAINRAADKIDQARHHYEVKYLASLSAEERDYYVETVTRKRGPDAAARLVRDMWERYPALRP